ncbi:MAG: hypothetical protein ACR2K1_02910 [Saprospiraceae bacterium]
MNKHAPSSPRGNRALAVILTVVVQLVLGYYLYQNAVQQPTAAGTEQRAHRP